MNLTETLDDEEYERLRIPVEAAHDSRMKPPVIPR